MKKRSYIVGLFVAISLVGCTGTSGDLTNGLNDGLSNSSNSSNNEGSETSNNNNEGSESSNNNEGSETSHNNGSTSSSTSTHNQGYNCAQCHSSGENQFVSGATVYSSASTFANGYTIRLVKSDGSLANYLEGRGTGNSHLITFTGTTTFTPKVVDATGNVVNSSATNSHDSSRLDCNRCHTAAGLNGAPGRILTKQTTTSTPPTTTPTTTTTTTTTFSAKVMPVLEANCKGCHGNSGRFTVTTASATYTNITSNGFVNTSTPTSSIILLRATGNSHGGGTRITTSSQEYATLKAWITEGAKNN